MVGISATLSIRDATLVIQQTAPHDLLRQGRRCQVRRERSGAQRDNIIASSCSRLGCGCQRTSWEQLKEMLAVLLVVAKARIINKLSTLCE